MQPGQFATAFESVFGVSQSGSSATEKWDTLRDNMHRTALTIFGKNTSKINTHDWFEAKSTEMTPVIEAKRAVLAEYKRSSSDKNLHILRAARNKAQQTARRCAIEYWTQLSEHIKTAAATGNISGMYGGSMRALGPVQNKTAPLKSYTGEIITDRDQQMERWVEHNLLQHIESTSTIDAIDCLRSMGELDTEPTLENLRLAIDSLASGNATGSDGIPPDKIQDTRSFI